MRTCPHAPQRVNGGGERPNDLDADESVDRDASGSSIVWVRVEQADEAQHHRDAAKRDRPVRERAWEDSRASKRETKREKDCGCDQKRVLARREQSIRDGPGCQLRSAERCALGKCDQRRRCSEASS